MAPQRREPADDPVGETEEPHFFGRGRLDGELVRVPGPALLLDDLVRVCAPARSRPTAGSSACCPTPRRARAAPTSGSRRAAASIAMPPPNCDEAAADLRHRHDDVRTGEAEIEVARGREIVGERRRLEVAETGRTDAREHQPVVQVHRDLGAEVRRHRVVDRARRLLRDERDADGGERQRERVAVLHRRHRDAHRDHERRRARPIGARSSPTTRLRADGRRAASTPKSRTIALRRSRAIMPLHRSRAARSDAPRANLRTRV